MTRTVWLAAAGAAAILACEQATETSGAGGGLALEIVAASGGALALDSGRVHLQGGPTLRVVRATPGSTVTIEELLPGSYTVSLQGFIGDEVERFGRTSGVQVVAGQNTTANVTLALFRPELAPFDPDSAIGLDATVTFGALTNAASYVAEIASDAGFTDIPVTETNATPSLPFTLPDFGTFFVRVRAVDPFDGLGVPSEVRQIRSVKPIVTLLSCGFGQQGDLIDRGFHIPSFPGSALSQVDVSLAANTPGDYTIGLEAFAGAYDGPVIGATSTSVFLSGNSGENAQTSFLFPSPPVVTSTTVAFRLTIIASPQPQPSVFYATGDGSPDCAQIIETNGTEPPLSTFRREGMAVVVHGRDP